MHEIFVDGLSGTTGLLILEQLEKLENITLLRIPEDQKKDPQIKADFLNRADLVVLCLPDEAAKESVRLIKNPQTKILDASTAHRTDEEWVYGLPELSDSQSQRIAKSSRVSNPGCYPTGFLLALRPLVDNNIVDKDQAISIFAISGYSGGGKKMIHIYESRDKKDLPESWNIRPYALSSPHKHLPEMWHYSGLNFCPTFIPSVANIFNGMLVTVSLPTRLMKEGTDCQTIHHIYTDRYQNHPLITVRDLNESEALNDGFLEMDQNNETNQLDLLVFGNKEQINLVARLDNLGKGASGAAVQNLKLMLGITSSSNPIS